MIRKAEEQLHEEQRILWKMKALFTQFRGDAVWAPVGMFHSEVDDLLLGTHRMSTSSGAFSADAAATNAPEGEGQELGEDVQMGDDVTVEGSLVSSVANGAVDVPVEGSSTLPQESSEQLTDAPTNGDQALQSTINVPAINGTAPPDSDATMLEPDTNEPSPTPSNNDSSAPSHRMTTRRQTRQPSRSPSPNASLASSVPPIHPFFTFPPTAIPDPQFGLPPQMADETRLALTSYISKQEEIVRNMRELHEGLLKALRMRRDVLEWCKAEGHEGEMSDHEDWVDLEEWGIEKRAFKKGMLEEEVDEEEERRGKRVGRGVRRGVGKD